MKEKVIIHIDSDLLLDIMEVDPYKGIYDEEEGAQTPSHDEVLDKKMEEALPEEASLVGYLDTDIESFCMSWAEKEHFYIMPWKADSQFDWTVFRIFWDDNWGKWEWAPRARVSGIKEKSEAAKYAVAQLFDHWSYDVTREDYQIYADFLKEL